MQFEVEIWNNMSVQVERPSPLGICMTSGFQSVLLLSWHGAVLVQEVKEIFEAVALKNVVVFF